MIMTVQMLACMYIILAQARGMTFTQSPQCCTDGTPLLTQNRNIIHPPTPLLHLSLSLFPRVFLFLFISPSFSRLHLSPLPLSPLSLCPSLLSKYHFYFFLTTYFTAPCPVFPYLPFFSLSFYLRLPIIPSSSMKYPRQI